MDDDAQRRGHGLDNTRREAAGLAVHLHRHGLGGSKFQPLRRAVGDVPAKQVPTPHQRQGVEAKPHTPGPVKDQIIKLAVGRVGMGRETEAEAVAFVVCQEIGLATGSAASDYIQLYDGKTETLAASLDRIQHVAADIIAAIQCPNEQAIAA